MVNHLMLPRFTVSTVRKTVVNLVIVPSTLVRRQCLTLVSRYSRSRRVSPLLSYPRAPLTQLQPPSANTNSPKLRSKEKEKDKDKAEEKKPGQHTPKVQKQPSLLQKQPSLLQKQASLPVRQEDKYIHAVPIEKLRSLTGDQLNIIWAQYDSDNSGSLDRRELKLLATDCIARTI